MYEITDSETAYRLHTKLGPLGPCTINGNLSLMPLPGKTHVGCNTFSGKDHGVRQTHTPRGASGGVPNYYKNIQLLTFLQSHTGVAMANAFQKMLQQFGLTEKIHSVNTNNTSPNNTLTTKLDQLDNTFKEQNRAQCFNHTLQLSAQALLKPFNVGLSGNVTDDDNQSTQDDNGDRVMVEDDEEDEDGQAKDEDNKDNEDNEDDNINELEELSEEERCQVLQETTVVRETVTKVSNHEAEDVRISLLTILSRFENFRLRSSTRPQLHFLLGAASAARCISRNASSPMMS